MPQSWITTTSSFCGDLTDRRSVFGEKPGGNRGEHSPIVDQRINIRRDYSGHHLFRHPLEGASGFVSGVRQGIAKEPDGRLYGVVEEDETARQILAGNAIDLPSRQANVRKHAGLVF